MPLYTGTHCLICYKKGDPAPPVEDVEGTQKLRKVSELVHRFCTLASRYLDLDPFHFQPGKIIKSKQTYNYERVCEGCLPLVESFCEIYYQREYLRLQLSWRANEIAEVMKKADEMEEGKEHRKMLEEKLQAMDSNMEEVDDFRNDFKKTIQQMRKECNPFVEIKKIDTPDEDLDDDLFIPFTVPKEEQDKKIGKSEGSGESEMKIEPAEQDKSDLIANTAVKEVQGNNRRRKRTAAEDLNQSVGGKRPKVSTKGRKKRGRKPKATMEESVIEIVEEKDNHMDHVNHISTLNDNCANSIDCGSSNKSESAHSDKTVIISNDNSNIGESANNFNHVSSQYQDDLLCSAGWTTRDDQDGSIWQWDLEGQTIKGLAMDNPVNSTIMYYKQFEHLQYKCSYPNCDEAFKTMTRMLVHQKAKGHNYNAVIDIILKR